MGRPTQTCGGSYMKNTCNSGCYIKLHHALLKLVHLLNIFTSNEAYPLSLCCSCPSRLI